MATNQENNQKVTVTKTVSVYPKSLHPPALLSLSNLDRQCPKLMYMVLFFNPSRSQQHTSVQSLFQTLKIGLEETLSVWFPAAGRLSFSQTDGKLDLLSNNAGAVLVEAFTQVKISELRDLPQYNEFYENLVFKPVFNGNISELPLVAAQVTRFGCGGYTVGVGSSHALFDGLATFNFLSAWATKTTMRRADEGSELCEAVHERGPLLVGYRRAQNQIIRLNNNPNPVTSVAAFNHLHLLIKQATSEPMLGGCKFSKIGGSTQESYILSTFHVGSAMVESLKRKISSHACSSFEVMAAHLWKARTKALGLSKGRMVCLQFAVDARNKIVPPLPRGFSGNAYVLASVCCTAGELEEASYDGTIEKIKEAKRSVNTDYVNAYIEALEAPQVTLPPLRELTMISDWTRTPFHKVDFGHGEASYASPLVPPLPQVAYFMQNPHETRGIDVRIGLLPQYLQAFSHYFLTKLH
ncbi:brassinosteroid-related acyltransferase 1 [Telopea speciosissima]|uniref:brassinosteroid-related acyltransferase 1 n=1 Tax=Telopea speciosissima TaxID=54955 RepID=UPI001CC4AC58|nr:brassinosteroid-related acyltransferase 1 [Telopea speciosissima]